MAKLRISLWSGPRNVSTALMYSFAQRSDTTVVDEPLYAHYLRVSGAEHPGREAVLSSQDPDGERVVRDVILGPCSRPVLFCKQMAHHFVELDGVFLAHTAHVFLVREPADMLASLSSVLETPTLRDTGLAAQSQLFARLVALGQDPPVLDSRRLLQDPQAVLSKLCARLGLPFEDSMLSWEAGPRPEDGCWAPHWYAAVHRSTGFSPWVAPARPAESRLRPALLPLLATCRTHYEELSAHAL